MELSTPHSDQPLLLGLAIFQSLHKLEYVRSIHLFKKGGYIHRIQQEFLSRGPSLKARSAPMHLACVSNEAHVKKAHMDMVRAKQESESWKCLLDFCTSPPRNPHLQTTQSLALDMLVVNACAKANALFMNASNTQENFAINWEHPHCILPSLSTCLQGYKPIEHEDHHMAVESPETTAQRLQLDLWQQWGSDLELASTRISQAFDLPLRKNHTNDANMAAYGAASSPMSRSLSNNNVDSSLWTHKPWVSTPLMMLNVMEEPQLNGETGRNVTGFACSLVLPNAQFESMLGESSTNCNIFGTVLSLGSNQMSLLDLGQAVNASNNKMNGFCNEIPFNCVITKPTTSTSITCSSSDERSLEAVNSGAPDRLVDDQGGSNGFPKAKESIKFRKSIGTRASTGRLTELTKDELTHYFNMPITQASKELKVGLTVLKKRCRIFGIPRWPHRKMKSINSLINNIQDLTKGDGDPDNDASRVQVAVEELEKQKKEMQERPGTQLPERTKRLRQACFKASYKRRRQALNDLGVDDRHNTAMNSSNSNSSNNSSSSNSFCQNCE